MALARQAICNHRGQQRIDATQHAEHNRIEKHDLPLLNAEHRHLQRRQPHRNFTDTANVCRFEQHDRNDRTDDQREQLRWQVTLQLCRHEKQDRHCDQCQHGFFRPYAAN